jgi:hypothetical protein
LVKDSLDTKIDNTDVEALTAIDVDNTPTANSSNLVKSGGVYTALSNKEDNANKVTSVVQSNTDTQYLSAKAVYDSFYKYGVVSQTQTWTHASDGGYDYTMSNLVWGNIPKANIDLYEAVGATLNTTSGYFELNGLTDISYEEMKKIYVWFTKVDQRTNVRAYSLSKIRTNIQPLWSLYAGSSNNGQVANQMNTESATNMCTYSTVEELYLYDASKFTAYVKMSSPSALFFDCKYIKNIYGKFAITSAPTTGTFGGCYSLETMYMNDIKFSTEIKYSPRLTLASIVYMVNNAANTSAITITLHADALARCTADTTEYEYNGNTYTGIVALANAKNITLASA